jgi:hypothetical protein
MAAREQPTLEGVQMTLRPWEAGDRHALLDAFADAEIQRWHFFGDAAHSVVKVGYAGPEARRHRSDRCEAAKPDPPLEQSLENHLHRLARFDRHLEAACSAVEHLAGLQRAAQSG